MAVHPWHALILSLPSARSCLLELGQFHHDQDARSGCAILGLDVDCFFDVLLATVCGMLLLDSSSRCLRNDSLDLFMEIRPRKVLVSYHQLGLLRSVIRA